MNKLLSLLMISLSWIIGMVAVFSFDQVPQTEDQQVSVQARDIMAYSFASTY
jgi:hypothetical protein